MQSELKPQIPAGRPFVDETIVSTYHLPSTLLIRIPRHSGVMAARHAPLWAVGIPDLHGRFFRHRARCIELYTQFDYRPISTVTFQRIASSSFQCSDCLRLSNVESHTMFRTKPRNFGLDRTDLQLLASVSPDVFNSPCQGCVMFLARDLIPKLLLSLILLQSNPTCTSDEKNCDDHCDGRPCYRIHRASIQPTSTTAQAGVNKRSLCLANGSAILRQLLRRILLLLLTVPTASPRTALCCLLGSHRACNEPSVANCGCVFEFGKSATSHGDSRQTASRSYL
jgi:hypothetical protein